MDKSSQILIDSNVLIGAFLPGDRLESRANDELKRIEELSLKKIIHPLVFTETLSILKYKGGLDLALDAKKIIENNFRVITVFGKITPRVEKIFAKYENVGMVDAMLIDYCLVNKAELITLDTKMKEIWQKLKRKN